MTYDLLGRPNNRSAQVDVTGDGVADTVFDAWTYDPVNAKGAPAAEIRTINGTTERWTGYTYDSLARPVQVDVVQQLAMNRPGFSRHLQAVHYGNHGGGYELKAVHGRIQG